VGIRSAPATWVALGLDVVGFIAILRLSYLFPFPYLFTVPEVGAGMLIATKQSARAGHGDDLAVAAVAVGCLGVVVEVAMRMMA